MPKQLDIQVKESESALLALSRKSKSNIVRNRLKALLLIKREKCEYTRDIVLQTGYTRKTIYNWLELYKSGGISRLCEVHSGGNNTKLLSTSTIAEIATLLTDPYSTIVSYVELVAILQKQQPELTYNSVYQHCKKHHGSKLKVARKSHYKKDEQAVEAFKKTT